MEKQILEILLNMQQDLTTVKNDVSDLKFDVNQLKSDVQIIQATVNRIEASQTEDVIGILKLNQKKTDIEVDYLNNRVTEMDKRIYALEKNQQN